MMNRIRRFTVPAAENMAVVGVPGASGAPGAGGVPGMMSQPGQAKPAAAGLAGAGLAGIAQIYALARQRAVADVQERHWNLLLRQLLEE